MRTTRVTAPAMVLAALFVLSGAFFNTEPATVCSNVSVAHLLDPQPEGTP